MADEHMKIIMGIAKDVAAINESVKSAHLRITELKQEIGRLRDGQNWLPKLVTSSAITAIVGGVVGFTISKFIGS